MPPSYETMRLDALIANHNETRKLLLLGDTDGSQI